MTQIKLRKLLRAAARLALLAAPCATLAAEPIVAADVLREGIERACSGAEGVGTAIASLRPGPAQVLRRSDTVFGWRQRLGTPGTATLIVERIAPGGQLRRASAELHDADGRPQAIALADGKCRLRGGRAILRDASDAEHELVLLDAQLAPSGPREPLNPRVPDGADPGGVTVALVDAGVNYLLPQIAARLARDADGRSLGFDYWDMDPRPFDAHPSRSAFYPQRHGTRTAGVLLAEAPGIRLLPYRYPRPDMRRMAALVAAAAAAGARIMNLSLGGNDPREWQAFADAARAHPQILFVASAGNNGRDIDRDPVYPAALRLENLLTVSSADLHGDPAPGSNWGARSVDLLVPGERIHSTGFDGEPLRVSGSSYAAARVSALAARLLARDPRRDTAALRRAVLALAGPAPGGLARGWIPDPLSPATVIAPEPVRRATHPVPPGARPPAGGEVFAPRLAFLGASGWTPGRVARIAERAGELLAQCGIDLRVAELLELHVPERLLDYSPGNARAVLGHLGAERPLVVFVREIPAQHGFEAMTFGTANSVRRPFLRFTTWFSEATRDPGIALAHELVHVLSDSGAHATAPGNLMRADTDPDNRNLDPAQCDDMRSAARGNAMLGAIAGPAHTRGTP